MGPVDLTHLSLCSFQCPKLLVPQSVVMLGLLERLTHLSLPPWIRFPSTSCSWTTLRPWTRSRGYLDLAVSPFLSVFLTWGPSFDRVNMSRSKTSCATTNVSSWALHSELSEGFRICTNKLIVWAFPVSEKNAQFYSVRSKSGFQKKSHTKKM